MCTFELSKHGFVPDNKEARMIKPVSHAELPSTRVDTIPSPDIDVDDLEETRSSAEVSLRTHVETRLPPVPTSYVNDVKVRDLKPLSGNVTNESKFISNPFKFPSFPNTASDGRGVFHLLPASHPRMFRR